MATLAQAWTSASAALPLGWELTGLLLETDGDRWLAMASDRHALAPRPHEEAYGATPQDALRALARKLARIRGNSNG